VSEAAQEAREFLDREKAFRLGALLTESSHPKTRTLSEVMQKDVPAGIRMLQSVDEDIPAALARVFTLDTYGRLVDALDDAMTAGRRIYFTGCGATGRLSILLEAAWRRFWRQPVGWGLPHQNRGEELVGHAPPYNMENCCISVMAGGDFALIKSVEGFEDYPRFGRHQLRQAGVRRGDVVVAITEGGETPFVIGTAWEALERGANVFFVYNNPTDALRAHVQRSREVIDEPRMRKLDLTTGPMAITGSTRMQAVTTELLVVGAALETALSRRLRACGNRSVEAYQQLFRTLLNELSRPEAVDAMSRAVEFEERTYRAHGLVTYAADAVLLDVLTDTTERSPTFMVPPFRKDGDARSPASWAFVKNPDYPTQEAWRDMLQRSPRGLTWQTETYRELDAPTSLRTHPPKLDNDEIHRFRIGNEPDPSRIGAGDSALVVIATGAEASRLRESAVAKFGTGYRSTAALTIGSAGEPLGTKEHFHVACTLPASPLRLWEHLAVKLVLNTISTATMVRLGRVIGNAMVWLSPSCKKLIDRGTRLISQVTGASYDRACEVLHETMTEVSGRARDGEEAPSPVALAIERIASEKDD
jgi:N-acetylmuramic acid 6-phosphate etherase